MDPKKRIKHVYDTIYVLKFAWILNVYDSEYDIPLHHFVRYSKQII